MIQKLDLALRHFPRLLSGEKTDTIRLNEGEVVPGLLLYESSADPTQRAVVWVTEVAHMKLRNVPDKVSQDQQPDLQQLEEKMRAHYPEITLDTEVMLVEHLTPQQTQERYPDDVARLLI